MKQLNWIVAASKTLWLRLTAPVKGNSVERLSCIRVCNLEGPNIELLILKGVQENIQIMGNINIDQLLWLILKVVM